MDSAFGKTQTSPRPPPPSPPPPLWRLLNKLGSPLFLDWDLRLNISAAQRLDMSSKGVWANKSSTFYTHAMLCLWKNLMRLRVSRAFSKWVIITVNRQSEWLTLKWLVILQAINWVFIIWFCSLAQTKKINCKSWEFCSNKVTNLFFIKTIIWLNL